MKRTELKRGTKGLSRGKGLKARSDRKIAADDLKPPVREAVFRRDGARCRLRGLPGAGQCFGGLTPHHRRRDSQGGAYSLFNLVAACSHHNELLESDADFSAAAEAAGLVVRRGHPDWDRCGMDDPL